MLILIQEPDRNNGWAIIDSVSMYVIDDVGDDLGLVVMAYEYEIFRRAHRRAFAQSDPAVVAEFERDYTIAVMREVALGLDI